MPKSGRERLAAYIERHFDNQYEFARLLKITEAYLSQILSGRRRPSLPILSEIEDITGIPMRAWVPTRRGTKKQRVNPSPIPAEVNHA